MAHEDFELASQVADVANVALWSGTSHRADRFNERWLSYTGAAADVWSAREWESAVHPEDRDRCRIAWNAAFQQPALEDTELRLLDRTSIYHWHRVRFVVTSGGRWFGIAHLRDLPVPDVTATSERAARDQAERASSLKDRFLAAVSHELRAPIAALLLWERVLREEDLAPEDRIRALEAIHHSAIVQARLVDDLVDVARASAGKLAVRLRPVELAGILERGAEDVRPLAAAGIGISTSMSHTISASSKVTRHGWRRCSRIC